MTQSLVKLIDISSWSIEHRNLKTDRNALPEVRQDAAEDADDGQSGWHDDAHIYTNLLQNQGLDERTSNKRSEPTVSLETYFPVASGRKEMTGRIISVRSPIRDRVSRLKSSIQKGNSGSGEKLCTNEFVIVTNYGGATAAADRDQRHPLTEGSGVGNTGVGWPNMIFDPDTNSARMISAKRTDKCRYQGDVLVHAAQCDGRRCAVSLLRLLPNETPLWVKHLNQLDDFFNSWLDFHRMHRSSLKLSCA